MVDRGDEHVAVAFQPDRLHPAKVEVVRLSVVLGEWLDRPIEADLAVAVEADRLGFGELWIGEMAKLDAPAMAAMIVSRTQRIEPCIGPLAVTVRSPAQIALAAATIAASGRRTHVALGTSSDVVARWHGRDRRGAAGRLEQATREVRTLFDGGRVNGFRLRQPPPGATVTVAAFGPRAVAVAATADRMVLNMVTVDAAAELAGRHQNAAVWLAAAVDPTPEERRWMSRGYVGYLGAPGYAEMFTRAGFGEVVEMARGRPHPGELAAVLPPDLLDAVAIVGTEADVRRRIDDYAAAGIAEIGLVVPPLDSPSGRRTLEVLAPR
jgi:probable F420-dependent oxidoreductase